MRLTQQERNALIKAVETAVRAEGCADEYISVYRKLTMPDTPLLDFCEEEAEYRMDENVWRLEETAKSIIERKGGDVKTMTRFYADTLYDNCEAWIDVGQIEAIMLDCLRDEGYIEGCI